MAALLGLINIGSSVAFSDTLSLLLESLYTSYLLACVLFLYRRIKGQIGNPTDYPSQNVAVKDARFQEWGPWHVPGVWGILNNAFACVYLTIICFFSFWPSSIEVTAANMNYSVLVTGSVAVVSLLYYLIWGKRTYQGPVVEEDAHWEMENSIDMDHRFQEP